MRFLSNKSGFTLLEIIFSIFILSILLLVSSMSFRNFNSSKELQTLGDAIVVKLEEAKTNSVTGKGGDSYGVKFNSDSYVYFIGTSYVESSSSNIVYDLPSNYEMTNTISGSSDSVVFSKINGDANNSGSINLYEKSNPTKIYQIVIGELGDVTVIE